MWLTILTHDEVLEACALYAAHAGRVPPKVEERVRDGERVPVRLLTKLGPDGATASYSVWAGDGPPTMDTYVRFE